MRTSPIVIMLTGLIRVHGTTKLSVLNYMELIFEGFITQARTDRYNIMCSLVAHDSMRDNKKDDESSIGDILIPNDATLHSTKIEL